ncbi:MAG: hypothetical protein LUD74_08870 [Tannerellaceae bacterium]|nr:hypothetical protein [Tannerellaceae bacterium]
MSQIIIAGIKRGSRFSPNHIGNDAAIFALTAQYLRQLGCIVNEYTETDLEEKNPDEKYIFNMVRDWRSIRRLQQLENNGHVVVNSGFGIENCTREKMTRILLDNDIAHPESLFLSTDIDPEQELERVGFQHCWIKRGDFHAIHREDVTYVRNREEARSILKEYALRGIPTAVINEHLVGDLVKFYGVAGTSFFHWFYPSNQHHSKFGLEKINGTAQGFAFDIDYLQNLCNKAAGVLNIHIYGGDCIVSEEGSIKIIDFNDWPSFAPCRDEAAPHIAQCIFNLFNQR